MFSIRKNSPAVAQNPWVVMKRPSHDECVHEVVILQEVNKVRVTTSTDVTRQSICKDWKLIGKFALPCAYENHFLSDCPPAVTRRDWDSALKCVCVAVEGSHLWVLRALTDLCKWAWQTSPNSYLSFTRSPYWLPQKLFVWAIIFKLFPNLYRNWKLDSFSIAPACRLITNTVFQN